MDYKNVGGEHFDNNLETSPVDLEPYTSDDDLDPILIEMQFQNIPQLYFGKKNIIIEPPQLYFGKHKDTTGDRLGC